MFIVGTGRSGTTFMHWLMSRDPQFYAPKLWELMSPVPPEHGPDNRFADVAKMTG